VAVAQGRRQAGAEYLSVHLGAARTHIEQRLASFMPTASPMISWVPGRIAAAFTDALDATVRKPATVAEAPSHELAVLRGLARAVALVDSFRANDTWSAAVGDALCQALGVALERALSRLAPRYIAERTIAEAVLVHRLPAAKAIDKVAARLICDARVVRDVRLVELGVAARPHAHEPVEVSDPVDATPAEVARATPGSTGRCDAALSGAHSRATDIACGTPRTTAAARPRKSRPRSSTQSRSSHRHRGRPTED
jgi:hypothetical protein